MDFSEKLLEKSRSPLAIFHRYRVDPSVATRPHIFVEGYDDLLFYGSVARRVHGEGVKIHLCYGKRNLDKIFDLFRSADLGSVRTLFLRDSDFDRYLGTIAPSEYLFLTLGYAVENYVCHPDAISSFIVSSFGLDPSEFDVDSEVDRFRSYVLAIFAWLEPLHGAAFKAIGEDRILDLDQLCFPDYFDMVMAGTVPPDPIDLPELTNIGLTALDFSKESLALAREFNRQECFLWLRGKYLICGLSQFLRRLEARLRALHKTGEIRQFNRKTHPDFSSSILIERLISHVRPDETLMNAFQAVGR